ncbi:MAG: hypothetical protein Q9220_005713 [cf. Caloplaca sp. 1 TL-2023]
MNNEKAPWYPPSQSKLGNYTLYNCDSANQTTLIPTILAKIHEILQPALIDLESGASNSAYNAFFKDSAHIPLVLDILTNVANGAIVAPGGDTTTHNKAAAPVLACTSNPERDPNTHLPPRLRSPLTTHLAYLYRYCRPEGNHRSTYIAGTSMIGLCPATFSLPFFPHWYDCGVFHDIRSDTWIWDPSFIKEDSQVATLMHDVLHYYIASTFPASVGQWNEVLDAESVWELAAGYSLWNVRNYELYVINVWMGCTVFPPRGQ